MLSRAYRHSGLLRVCCLGLPHRMERHFCHATAASSTFVSPLSLVLVLFLNSVCWSSEATSLELSAML